MKQKEINKSWRQIHSPFLFDIARHLEGGGKYVEVGVNSEIIEQVAKIEHLRQTLSRSSDYIEVEDFGAGSKVFKNNLRPIKKIVSIVLQQKNVAFSLMRLLLFWKSKRSSCRILEMGTSLGLTTAYLAASGWEVETWEGCRNTSSYARRNWKILGCEESIKCKTGKFETLLNQDKGGWDVVFLDGHHDGLATLEYIEILKTMLNKGGAILIDDIDWSEGMKAAWIELLEDAHWNVTMKWRGKGWLFNRVEDFEQHLKLRKSYIPLSKFNKMKRFTIVFAAVTMLMSSQVQAQISKSENNTKGKAESSVITSEDFKIYGEMTAFELNGKSVVKISFDPILNRIGADKKAISTAYEISNVAYASLGQALNVLSSNGWYVDAVWTTLERSGTVQHFLISKKVSKLSPASPWLDKNTHNKNGGKENGSRK
ncbi:MAG: hypothetical protein COA49_07425 [Bacteroidetes bacterium]|nr:MAG: hypothetical protein COA49_07425 [Bacteroidota bacterium]